MFVFPHTSNTGMRSIGLEKQGMNTASLRFHLLIFHFMLRTIHQQDKKPPTISHLMDKPKIEQFYYLNESKCRLCVLSFYKDIHKYLSNICRAKCLSAWTPQKTKPNILIISEIIFDVWYWQGFISVIYPGKPETGTLTLLLNRTN